MHSFCAALVPIDPWTGAHPRPGGWGSLIYTQYFRFLLIEKIFTYLSYKSIDCSALIYSPTVCALSSTVFSMISPDWRSVTVTIGKEAHTHKL